ncbi:MAG: zinc ribbon domain-containing protein [Actinomycetota bacterium]
MNTNDGVQGRPDEQKDDQASASQPYPDEWLEPSRRKPVVQSIQVHAPSRTIGILVAICGAVAIGSTFLPWYRVRVTGDMALTGWQLLWGSGAGFRLWTSGNGWMLFSGAWALAFGAVLITMGFIFIIGRGRQYLGLVAVGVLATCIATVDTFMVYEIFGAPTSGNATPGIGLFIFFAGSLSAALLGIIGLGLTVRIDISCPLCGYDIKPGVRTCPGCGLKVKARRGAATPVRLDVRVPVSLISALRGIVAPLVAAGSGGVMMLTTGMTWLSGVYPPAGISGWGFTTWSNMSWSANPLVNSSPATGLLFTGMWSLFLGLLVLAGVILAVTRWPAGRLVAVSSCFLGVFASAVTILSIERKTASSGFTPGIGLYLFLACSLAGGIAAMLIRPLEVKPRETHVEGALPPALAVEQPAVSPEKSGGGGRN